MNKAAPATRVGGALQAKIGLVSPVLRVAGDRMSSHPRPDAMYVEYVTASHWVVRASVPLMRAALSRAEAAGDAAASGLVPYLRHHIDEEAGHDEWLLEDLETIGIERSRVLARPPSPAVASLVGAQYYWVLHHHPVALLGYMAVLEGHPPTREQIDTLVQRTGFPRRAFRTLLDHADLDARHAGQIFALLDELPLRHDLVEVIGLSAMHTVLQLSAVIDAAVDAVPHVVDDELPEVAHG